VKLTLHVWRQANASAAGAFETYAANDVSPDMSFLEMLDIVNESLMEQRKEPIAFDHDCREGICGTCGLMINGLAHGPRSMTTVCQLHMREFTDGDELWIEPWRAAAFPVRRDLSVDRSSFDRIIQAGGYISIATGNAPEANSIPIGKESVENAMDAAACIGCGACVAACPNGSASLFTAAKITHLGTLPQGQPERYRRALKMVARMDLEHFGGCTLFGECHEACPKGISLDTITRMNRDYLLGSLMAEEERSMAEGTG
jgi:succinate dehydrogenase / fumarate reductase iron-sulfur subunit